MLGNLEFTADYYPLGLLGAMAHLRSIRRFWDDAAQGTLPAVSIVDPDFSSCSEENPQDIRSGEAFAARVINAVMEGKGWGRTLLIWLYDEHGGYFDHVEPPVARSPDDVPARSLLRSGLLSRLVRLTPWASKVENIDAGPSTYDRYGFRVPAVIVSPYARPDYICQRTLDHTSILKLIERKWNLPALTRRDAAALDPLDALDLEGPPAFIIPPRTRRPIGGSERMTAGQHFVTPRLYYQPARTTIATSGCPSLLFGVDRALETMPGSEPSRATSGH